MMLFLALILILGVYWGWRVFDSRNVQFLMAISHSHDSSDTYYFRLRHNGMFEVMHGTNNHVYFERLNFMRIGFRRERRLLTDEEHKRLVMLADNLHSSNVCSSVYDGRMFVFGTYLLEIQYRGIIYSMVYFDGIDSEYFNELINQIIALSPMQIHLRSLELFS